MAEGKVLIENRVDLKNFKLYGFDFDNGFKAMGWENYFFWKPVEVLVTAVKEFWGNVRLLKGGIIEGHIRGFTFLFTIENISEVTGCPREGIVYYPAWADAFNGIERVNKDLFEDYEKLKESGETITAKHLKTHYRVLHKIITKCVWLKAGSSDIVNYEQKFIMRHYMAGLKINLPRLIFNNLVNALVNSRKGVADKKNVYKTIPYGVLLTEMMAKNLVVNKLTALSDEEKIKYFGPDGVVIPDTFGVYNLVRMKLITGDQMKKVKIEKGEEVAPSVSSKSVTNKPTRSSAVGEKRTADSSVKETRSKKQKVSSAPTKKSESEDEDNIPIKQILKKRSRQDAEKPTSASDAQTKVIQRPPPATAPKQKLKRMVRQSEAKPKVTDFTEDESISMFTPDDAIPAPPLSVSQTETQTPTQTQTQTLQITTLSTQTSTHTSLSNYFSKLHSHPFNLLFKIPPINPFKAPLIDPRKYTVKKAAPTPLTLTLTPTDFDNRKYASQFNKLKFVKTEPHKSIYDRPSTWYWKTFTSGAARLEIPPPMDVSFKDGEDVFQMTFKGRLRPEAGSRAIPFSIDFPKSLPQNEPLTLEECGRWITDDEAAMMAFCLEQKRMEVIREYRDPSSVIVKVVPDRQRWLPWSIPGKRKELAPGKMPFSKIGPVEYKKAPRDFKVIDFQNLPLEKISEDHARRYYLSSLKKDEWRTGSSECCNAEKATFPTVGKIKKVPESNLGTAYFDDMFMCSVIRPMNLVKLYAPWDLFWKYSKLGISWMDWSPSWKDNATLPNFEPYNIDEDDRAILERLYHAENEGLNFSFDAMKVFISNVFGEARAEQFDGYTKDVFMRRQFVFNNFLFPELVEQREEVLRESERRKLGTIIKWFPPGDNYFQWAKERKKIRFDLSQAVLEEHKKMIPLSIADFEPEAESAPSTSSVEMVTIPKQEFDTMIATCLKVPELEAQLKLIMDHIKLQPPRP